jgi:hypothetical protein
MTGDRREKVQAAFLALIMVLSVMTASVAFAGSSVVADTSTGFAAANPADADTSINDADHTYVLNLSATGTDFSDTLGDGTGTDTITISNSNGSQFDWSGVTASEIVVGCMMPAGIRRRNIPRVVSVRSPLIAVNYSSI